MDKLNKYIQELDRKVKFNEEELKKSILSNRNNIDLMETFLISSYK